MRGGREPATLLQGRACRLAAEGGTLDDVGADEDARRDESIADAAAILDGLVGRAEHERAHEPDGAMAQWLDTLLAELRPIAEQVHDLAATQDLFGVVGRHGSGPWPAEDLAAIAGIDPATVQRVLDKLTDAGIARPGPGGQDRNTDV